MSIEREIQTKAFEDRLFDSILFPASTIAVSGITRVASEITGAEPGEWVMGPPPVSEEDEAAFAA